MMQKVIVFFVFIVTAITSCNAQSEAYLKNINAVLQSFEGDTALQHASWGFCLISDKDGKIISSNNEKRSLQPASTTKVLTTSAALSILGSDYTFKTRLAYKGKITKQGVLLGDVYVIGGGDPSIGFNRIKGVKNDKELIDAFEYVLRKAGINTIQGSIIADATYFERAMQPNAWAWDDIANYYGAGPSGLNFRENQYNLYLKQSKTPGEPCAYVCTYPLIPGLQCYSEIVSGAKGSGDEGYIYGASYSNLRYLRGKIPPGDTLFCIKGSLPDPALICAQLLAGRMTNGKVTPKATTVYLLQEQNNMPDTNSRTILLSIASPPLKELVKYTNIYSINLYAETLLKEIGKKVNGKGSTEEGLRVLKQFWLNKGIDLSGLFLLDGSGLSRYDAITAEQFAQAIHAMRSEKAFADFYLSLSVAGQFGALSSIGKGTVADGNIHAKSGYMTRVRSYAGYVRNKEGKEFSFAFIINNYSESAYSVKMKIEKLLIALAE